MDVTIPAIGQLHEMIAKSLLSSDRDLTAAQFRFITSSTMMSEAFLARVLAVSVEDLRAMRRGRVLVTPRVQELLRELMNEQPFSHVAVTDSLHRAHIVQSADRLASEMVIPAPLLGRNARVRLAMK